MYSADFSPKLITLVLLKSEPTTRAEGQYKWPKGEPVWYLPYLWT